MKIIANYRGNWEYEVIFDATGQPFIKRTSYALPFYLDDGAEFLGYESPFATGLHV